MYLTTSPFKGGAKNTILPLPQVMEEAPEAHMETDVSSTTEDVPEAQEVTGSSGNVEMVLIVENVTEDNSTPELGGKQAAAGEQAPTSSNTPSPQKPVSQSPKISPQKLESKPPNSPNKVLDTSTASPSKEHSYNKTPDKSASTTLSTTQPEETVDSSSKIEVKSPSKNSTPKKLSPIKVIDIQKSPKIITVSPKPSPNKEQVQEAKISSPEKSPVPEKPALNGTIENVPINENEKPDNTTASKDIVPEKEILNDSHMESGSDVSEKEHNKSISRELKSLIKSAKESKIISECTQLTTKTRKSRTPLDVSNSSLNTSVEAEKIKDTRRCSENSQKSNCSEKSEKVSMKRSMRSQNPEFVNKVKQFLNSVTSKVQKESDEGTDEEATDTKKELKVNKDTIDSKREYSPSLAKKKKIEESVSIYFILLIFNLFFRYTEVVCFCFP